jgi:deoxyribodipyrimidine photo-lyase
LLDALADLAASLAVRGSRLTLVPGKSVEVIPKLSALLGGARVLAHRWVEPFARERDRRVKEALGDRFTLYEGETLLTPGSVRTQGGGPYAVFTPFSRACRRELDRGVGAPIPPPPLIPTRAAPRQLETCDLPTLDSLGLTRNPRVIAGGETHARQRLDRFVAERLSAYPTARDRMDLDGTSRLSADLKFGALSIREVYGRVASASARTKSAPVREAADKFLSELLWREFTHHTLWDHPEVLRRPFRATFEGFPWRDDERALEAWRQGATGYPIVDAAARQLVLEGYVHNRARMIAASFLTKHLLIDYRLGEAHYLKHLVDGDWAQNNAGWQWSAGCGCDAAPLFPRLQPCGAGAEVRPRGGLHPAVPPPARGPSSRADSRPVGGAGPRARGRGGHPGTVVPGAHRRSQTGARALSERRARSLEANVKPGARPVYPAGE